MYNTVDVNSPDVNFSHSTPLLTMLSSALCFVEETMCLGCLCHLCEIKWSCVSCKV